jgi:hypothetical protein
VRQSLVIHGGEADVEELQADEFLQVHEPGVTIDSG